MGSRGDLLALVDGAPGRLRTLQAALTIWTHRERAAAARRATDDEAGDEPAHAPVVPGPFGWDDPDAESELIADPLASASALASPSAGRAAQPSTAGDGPETFSSWYAVVALPDRWRVIGRGHVAVCDGRRSWVGTSTLVTERDSARAAIHDAGAIGACLYPGPLLRGLELDVPRPEVVAGRPCWRVDARPRSTGGDGGPSGGQTSPRALRLLHDLVGVEHRLWLDAATGIVLRHEGFVAGEMCSTTELTDLVFDAPVAGDQFRPPPGAVVRSRHELLRDHLSELGVDPDTVDLDDPAQVRAALRQGG